MAKHAAPDDIYTGDGMTPVLTITNEHVAEIIADALSVYSLRLAALGNETNSKTARAFGMIAAIQCQQLRNDTVDAL